MTSHSDNVVNLWNSEDLSMYTNLMNFGNPITQIRAAPNQPFLATCDSDSRMKIYKSTKKLPILLELSHTKT